MCKTLWVLVRGTDLLSVEAKLNVTAFHAENSEAWLDESHL